MERAAILWSLDSAGFAMQLTLHHAQYIAISIRWMLLEDKETSKTLWIHECIL